MVHLELTEISDVVLKKARHFHLSSVFLQKGLFKGISQLFKRAKDLGLTTSMDPQWDPEEKWSLDLQQLLPHVDVFMPNAEEFKYLTKSEDIYSGLTKVKSFSKNIIIKDGINGAHLWNGTKLLSGPAFLNRNTIDCIGAGDSFDAGFISEFLKGKDMEKCLEAGNLTGAINTTASGGTAAFENLVAIKEIAKNRFSYDL
jgi:sugar/nucleoside kinase (ribokinase family)